MIRQNFLESIMADPHQVISITATAICDLRKDPLIIECPSTMHFAICLASSGSANRRGIADRANQQELMAHR
jgi:hypothetical protein